MRLGVIAGAGKDWKQGLERIRIAEDLGYEHVTAGEAWGPSALPFLTLVAANTSRVTLGTAILNCFSRSPAVLAQEFAMLDQISQGRAVLGLGSVRAQEQAAGALASLALDNAKNELSIAKLIVSFL